MEWSSSTQSMSRVCMYIQKKKYGEAEARCIFEQVAHALAYLHAMNIVHRYV